MWLRDIWYFALPSRQLRAGQMLHKTILGRPVLFGRTAAGEPFAMEDICPHRGIPLSHGRFDGCEVECCYHGWRFDQGGTCTAIPSLVEGQHFNLERVKVQSFPLRESRGCLWIWHGDAQGSGEDLPPPPEILALDDGQMRIVETMRFPCDIDHAVVGLMDPAHGPYVHQSWWWRSRHSMHEKAKGFAPTEQGFQMVRHRPSSNSFAYKLLGGAPETEIRFRLPGLRFEHITTSKYTVVGLTAVTPLREGETEVNHLIYWDVPWLTPFTPVLRRFARRFLRQDRDVVELQQEGLAHEPSLMLINDADTQARWYHQLKREWGRASEEGRPFINPIQARTLRWRS